jgi:hypothetical protein
MGLEFISQPQIFTQRLTALGGIEGYAPPLWSSFYTWTSTTPTTADQLPLDGTNALVDFSGGYIVTIGGVLQSPATYTVDVTNRTITFDQPVNEDTDIVITQIGTIALTSLGFQELSAVNGSFDSLTANTGFYNTLTATSLLINNLTALSSVLNVVDITTYELSGFEVQGDVTITGSITAAGPVVFDTDSSIAALRVTQRGSGNVIEIEDSNNPDSTPFVVTSDGNVGIGTSSPITELEVSGTLTTTNAIITSAVVDALSAASAVLTTPLLSTDNSTQLATTNFVRQFGGFQNAVVYTSGTASVNLSSLGAGIEKIKVTVVGGGGAGGGTAAAIGACGSGGGSGGVTIKYINDASTLGTSFSYVIGAGGTGGTGIGGAGEASSFTLGTVSVSANGGSGGLQGAASLPVIGGAGATASTTGHINLPGVAGIKASASAAINTAASGEGGGNMFGGGGVARRNTANQAGDSGTANTGGGGSGGAAATAAAQSGGSGGSGVVIIEY